MSDLPFIIRPLDNATEADAFLEMFESVYGHPISRASWQWKYHQAPGGVPINLVAQCPRSGLLLGHIGAVALPGRHPGMPGQAIQWVQIGDIMVREQARSDLGPDGLYRHLVQQMQQALQAHGQATGQPVYAYGFPGRRPSKLGERLRFYRELYVCEQHSYALPASPPAGWRGWLGSWARRQAPQVRAAQPQDPTGSWAHGVWSQVSSGLPGPGLTKNAAYLQWRYLQHPERAYRLWWFGRKSQSPSGWIVTNADDAAGAPLTVIDSLLPEADWPAAVQALAALHPERRCQGWRAAPGSGAEPTPIVAVEFGIPAFRADWPTPRFQPGDTDVF